MGCALFLSSRYAVSGRSSSLAPSRANAPKAASPAVTAETAPETRPIPIPASEIPPESSQAGLPKPAAAGVNPGIVIWEPAGASGNADQMAFGAGCARWLDWAVGGLPEMGRQCAFTSCDHIAIELGRRDLRLTAHDAVLGGRRLGVTHVAVSEISGGSGKLTLKFTVLETKVGKQVGAPIEVSGTAEQIDEQLPGIAKQIAVRTGVVAPRTPAKVGATPDDLTAYGRFPWRLTNRVPLKEIREFERLGRTLPAAAVSVLDAVRWQDPENIDSLAKAAIAKSPGNVLTVSEVAKQAIYAVPGFRESVAALLRAHPNSYLLVRADLRVRQHVSPQNWLDTMRRAASLSPGNPDAWNAYVEALNSVAQGIRHGKVYVDMTPTEEQAVTKLYRQAEAASIRAIRLNPQYGFSWRELAVTAQFIGHDELANDAFWKAAHLDRNDTDLYLWGLQMFQDKWQGGKDKLQKVATLASQEVFQAPVDARTIGLELMAMGYSEEAKPQIDRAITAYKEMIAERADPVWPQLELAATYRDTLRLSDAAAEYRTVIDKNPKCEAAHVQYGELHLEMHANADAEREFREAVSLCPKDEAAHGKLGYALILSKKWDEGEKEIRRGIKADPQWGKGIACLGYALQMQHQLPQAILQYKTALSLVPTDGVTWDRLTRAYNESGRFKEAVAAGEHGMLYNRSYDYAYASLGEAYLGAGENEKSAAVFDEYLTRNPRDAGCHMLYARALYNLGRNADAASECNTCIRLMPASPAAAIARDLLKKHKAS
jgi:tetratricopeptide (TPR) repeat protein